MMMSGPALVSMAEAILGLRSFILIRSTVTSTPASLPNSAASRLNSTSEAGTKLTHSRMLSFVPFGKVGAFCAATMPGIPPTATAPVAAPATLRNARRSSLVTPPGFAMLTSETLNATDPRPSPSKRWRSQHCPSAVSSALREQIPSRWRASDDSAPGKSRTALKPADIHAPTVRAVARRLHQLVDEGLRDFRSDAKRTVRQGPAVAEDRFELVQRRQILALPEEADRDDLAPLAALLHGGLEVGRVVTHLFQLAGPLLEELVRVVVVVRHAGTEGVDQGEAILLEAPLDQLDQLLLLTG